METAFILGAATPGLGVIRALGQHGVPIVAGVSEAWDMGRSSKYAGQVTWLPSVKQEQAYIDCLLDDNICAPGAILMPTADETLSLAARNKTVLQQKYIVACPDWEITELFLDKKRTGRLAEQAGVPAPKTFTPHSLDEIETIAPALQYPCLAKPSVRHLYELHFKRKMTWVENLDELRCAFQEADALGVEIMVQEYIPGPDTMGANYNAFYWEGQPLAEFTAHKLRNAPPAMGSPSALVSEKIPEIMAAGRKLLEAAKFSGFACSEWKFDQRDGVYKLMEVNARHNLSTLLAVRCGLDFPWIDYQFRTQGVIPAHPDFETGVYWVDVYRDVKARLDHLGEEEVSLRSFWQPYLKKHVDAVFAWDDIGPFFTKAKTTARELVPSKAAAG